MRAPFPLLSIALLTLAALPAAAQNAPFVLFCQGQCFAVDDKGVRTPAPKGTVLREGQRLETGADSYAQLRLGPDAALGIGESARIRFDQKSISDRDLVILDQGRIRMVGGEALGRPDTRTIELRTNDGNFVLRGADIEVKMAQVTGGPASGVTLVKLNVGDARLGDVPITKDGVQGITRGAVITDRTIPLHQIALPRREVPSGTPAAPLPALPQVLLPATVLGPTRLEPIVPSTFTQLRTDTTYFYVPPPPPPPVIKVSDIYLVVPQFTDTNTGAKTSFTDLALQSKTTVAPSLTTSGVVTTQTFSQTFTQQRMEPLTTTTPKIQDVVLIQRVR